MTFEEKYLAQLYNLEFAIMTEYKMNSQLTDYDVSFALEALIEFYKAEANNRISRKFNLSESSERIFIFVETAGDLLIGKTHIENEENKFTDIRITINELIDCLKKLKKSVERWTKIGGRQGYLEFVKHHMPEI